MLPFSPLKVIFISYSYLGTVLLIFYSFDIYRNSAFFSWGTPVVFFGNTITSDFHYYLLHFLMFSHQMVNNLMNDVVYSWIINSVQNSECHNIYYGRNSTLVIINLFNIFSQLDMVFIFAGFTSQISFVFNMIISNCIISTYVNNRFLLLKNFNQPLE